MTLLRTLIVSSFLSVLFLGAAQAGPIYKWQDEQGVIHYSTKPNASNAKPADLPPITRGDVKLAQIRLVSCDGHGGINCKLGADSDGSVICYDGFRGATARYRFSCNSPKLEVSDISGPEDDGTFKVFVRNSKSVTAEEPAVVFKPSQGQGVKLKGPKEVEAFGMAEFIYSPQLDSTGAASEPPTYAQLDITCANCP
ncbi:MAG: hypothetical protein DCC75_04780 [Proteobacteria bacterium]|nr:MAG: hypothetical protein DCC75_04780 [Pseudomonadota bacterium]